MWWNLFGRRRPAQTPRRKHVGLQVELLEARVVPSASVLYTNFGLTQDDVLGDPIFAPNSDEVARPNSNLPTSAAVASGAPANGQASTPFTGVVAADSVNPALPYHGVQAPQPVPANSSFLYVSTTGNDANNGASSTTALRNIQTALNRATPGTTIEIAGGTYYEQLITKVAGTAAGHIVLTSYNGTAVIDGSTQNWALGGDQNLGVVELTQPYYELQNLKIINSKDTGIVLDASNLTINGCDITNCQRHGISTDTNRQTAIGGTMIQNINITNNFVHWNVLLGHGYGQAISLIADGFLVQGNWVQWNFDIGIDVWLGSSHGEVANNAVSGNTAAGIYDDGCSYIRIDANQVYNNGSGIGVSSEDPRYNNHDIWVYNNVVYQNAGAGLFLWDSLTTPGYHGSQWCLLANNTLINNVESIDLRGDSNICQIINNLEYATGNNFSNSSTNSSYAIYNNVVLTSLTGFIAAGSNNYYLVAGSPAINQGAALPILRDNLGDVFVISQDAGGRARVVGGAPDAGAYEYQYA
jgi:parallel beta-helix repeat protein